MTPRREFSAKTRRAAWERCGGLCEGIIQTPLRLHGVGLWAQCRAPIDVGSFHYDHVDPDWYSKDNELSNCQLLCRVCHSAKTKRDVKDIAKSKRIIDKRIKARKPRGRPLMGTKRSGWKRKVSGEVARR